jgi:phosphosulfolactate phosphohydrolase-like enzyme
MNASAHSSISRFLVSLGMFKDPEYCSAHLFADHVPVSYLLIALPHNAKGLGFRD